MHSTDYYSKVKDLISRDKFEKLVDDLDAEFDSLLDREILEYLIVDEMGRNKKSIVPISEIKPNQSCTIFGKVMEKLAREKYLSLIISDNTLSCFLNLWGRNADIGESVEIGDVLKIVNGYSRLGREGLEVNVGKWSYVEANPKDAPSIEIRPVYGTLVEKEDTEVKFDDNGDVRFFKRIWLKENGAIFHVNVWDNHVKLVNKLREGDFIEIENPVRRVINGRAEIEVRAASKIITKS